MELESSNGWTKPERKKTLAELKALIAEKQKELTALVEEARELEHDARLQAIATARNIMRAHELTIQDVM